MKIAVVRGDFLSGWELPIFEPWLKNNKVTLFLGKIPIFKLSIPKGFKVVRLWNPVDLNFGMVRRPLMAALNRVFIDAHLLFGLERELKGYDVAYTAETFYNYSRQCVEAREKGLVKAVVMHAGENIVFNNEGIWGRRALKQYVINGTDKFIAITDRARDVLIEEGADPKKIVRLNPGVDLKVFRPLTVKHTGIRLLTVCRLVPEKGIKEMVVTFKRLRKQFPELEFTVVGTGPLEKILDVPGITHIPRAKFEDMARIYSSADIYIHYPVGSKTWLEQWGFVLAEAMACGLPVVGLDRGSVKEVVVGGGAVVKNQKHFEETLEKLIRDNLLRRHLAKKALAFARKNYDVDKFSAGVLKVFKQVIDENHRRHR